MFYKFALRRLNRKNKALWISTCLTAIVCNIAVFVTPIIQRELLNSISEGNISYSKILLLCLVSGISIIAIIYESISKRNMSLKIQRSLQSELLENAIRSNNKNINARGPGAYMVSVFGDSEHIADLITLNIWDVVFQIVTAIAIIIITARWSMLFAFIVLPTMTLMIIIQIVLEKLSAKRFKKGREKVYEINPLVLEYLENRKTILGYANLDAYEQNIYDLFELRDSEFKKAYTLETLSASFISSLKTVSLVALFIFSLFEIKSGRMEVSTFIAFISYMGVVFQPISAVKALIVNNSRFQMFYGKISSSLQTDLRLGLPDGDSICMHECSFQYENGVKSINNISIHFDNVVGLVGLSGEGKTTLIRIILGDNNPDTGYCMLGTRAVSTISKFILNSYIRYYSQDSEVFNKDLEANIVLDKKPLLLEEYQKKEDEITTYIKILFDEIKKTGRLPKDGEASQVIKELFNLNSKQIKDKTIQKSIVASIRTCDDNCIDKLGNIYTGRKYYIREKYVSLIRDLNLTGLEGRALGQRGSQISGGEKSRIVLARFLLPECGEFFILDEPLTNVDIFTENKCIETIQKYLRCTRGVIISHKMNIIKSFSDSILVLNEGKIIETGTHDSLLESKQLYSTLWNEYVASIDGNQ